MKYITPSASTYAYSAKSVLFIILHLCLDFLKCGSGYKKNIFFNYKDRNLLIKMENCKFKNMIIPCYTWPL